MPVKKKSKKSKTSKKRKVVKKPKRHAKKKRPPKHLQTMTIINEKLSQLEGQALKAYECVQAIRRRSTPDWKEWIEKLSPQDWMALAGAQRDRISLEVKNLSDEILSKIHGADILNGKDKLLKEAKNNLEVIIKRIDHSSLVEKAIDTAVHTKDGLLAFLNIPTHEEMTQLQRKLKRLERKMGQLNSKGSDLY